MQVFCVNDRADWILYERLPAPMYERVHYPAGEEQRMADKYLDKPISKHGTMFSALWERCQRAKVILTNELHNMLRNFDHNVNLAEATPPLTDVERAFSARHAAHFPTAKRAIELLAEDTWMCAWRTPLLKFYDKTYAKHNAAVHAPEETS